MFLGFFKCHRRWWWRDGSKNGDRLLGYWQEIWPTWSLHCCQSEECQSYRNKRCVQLHIYFKIECCGRISCMLDAELDFMTSLFTYRKLAEKILLIKIFLNFAEEVKKLCASNFNNIFLPRLARCDDFLRTVSTRLICFTVCRKESNSD